MIPQLIAAYLLASMLITLICASIIILNKKDIHAKYYQSGKKLKAFDYLQDLDGNWLIYKIDYDQLLLDHPTDSELCEKIKVIKTGYKIMFGFLISFFVVGAVVKCLGIM